MTSIEWTKNPDGSNGKSWNPIRAYRWICEEGKEPRRVRGWFCEHVHQGCKHCYAETQNVAMYRGGTGLAYKPGHRAEVEIELDEATLREPLSWRKPTRIFVCSMSDLFGAWVERQWLDRIFTVAALCPQHTFIILTKRPALMRGYFEGIAAEQKAADDVADIAPQRFNDLAAELTGSPCAPHIIEDTAWPLPNVWLLTSCSEQKDADEFIPDLLATPAAVRGVSLEPLLGPIDLESAWHGESALNSECWGDCAWCVKGYPPLHNCRDYQGTMFADRSGLDWVIVGGESGHDARPMHPDWVRSLQAQCADAGVPFFFKQWGAFKPVEGLLEAMALKKRSCAIDLHGNLPPGDPTTAEGRDAAVAAVDAGGYQFMSHVGKGNAGRSLDGVEHNGAPAQIGYSEVSA